MRRAAGRKKAPRRYVTVGAPEGGQVERVWTARSIGQLARRRLLDPALVGWSTGRRIPSESVAAWKPVCINVVPSVWRPPVHGIMGQYGAIPQASDDVATEQAL
jgi:hypothetical protein